MKKLLLLCAFVMGISAVSFAQGRGGFGGTPDQQVDRLKTQLTGITDDQTAKLKVIYAGQAKVMDSLRTAMQNGGDMAAMRPAFTKMNDATNAKIMAVLTPDQATAYKKIVDERAAAMKARMNGN